MGSGGTGSKQAGRTRFLLLLLLLLRTAS